MIYVTLGDFEQRYIQQMRIVSQRCCGDAMTPDLENIQTIRRLIRAKRYEEAYSLLKQTIHPQVPALEIKLQALIADNQQKEHLPDRSNFWILGIGLFMGGLFAGGVYYAGVQNIVLILVCFLIGFILGMIILEHSRYHLDNSEYFITQRKKNSRKDWRW